MTPVTEIYGRKASDGRINWITAIAMTAFHVGAVAALFFINWGAIAMAGCSFRQTCYASKLSANEKPRQIGAQPRF